MTAELVAQKNIVNQLRSLAKTNASYQLQLADALIDLAGDLQGVGQVAEGVAAIREARHIYEKDAPAGGGNAIKLALCLNHEANWLADAGDLEAEQAFAAEGAVLMSLAKTLPVEQLGGLVAILQGILDVNMDAKRFRSAENAARACIELARRAAERDATAEAYLASSYTSLASALMHQNRIKEAYPEAVNAAHFARRAGALGVPGLDPTVLVTALNLVAKLAEQCGRPDEARAALKEIRAQR